MFSTVTLLLILTLILLIITKKSNCVVCPPPSSTPCNCNATTKEISCRGSLIKLEEVFDQFVDFIPENERDFDAFYLNIRGLTRLEPNIFRGIRFRNVILGGSKLTYIHKDAFLGTDLHIKELSAFATNLSIGDHNDYNYNLFDSISSLKNLQRLVISGSNIVRIPDRAFKPRDHGNIQQNLSEIELGMVAVPTIESIGLAPFADLPALKSLGFSKHRINHIKSNAFSFRNKSNKTLIIDLTGNNLNDSSFEIGCFLGANRPVKIYFGLNGCNYNMNFLNQAIFQPFFEENPLNSVDIGRYCRHMICDCRMDWILNGNYQQRVRNLKCSDGLPLGESNDRLNTLSRCESDDEKTLIEQTTTEETVYEKNDIEPDYESNNQQTPNICSTQLCLQAAIEMNKYLNESVNPCDNFYDYACGYWKDSHLSEYLTQYLSNGGVEYDNFVKLRQQVDENLDLILSQNVKSTELNIIKQSLIMYQKCKANQLESLDLLLNILDQIGGWPIVSNSIPSDDYKWQNALVIIFANIRRDILITLGSTNDVNSVRQLKLSCNFSYLMLFNALLAFNEKLHRSKVQSFRELVLNWLL